MRMVWIVIVTSFVLDAARAQDVTLESEPRVSTLAEYPSGTTTLLPSIKCEPAATCLVNILNIQPSNPCGTCFAIYSTGTQGEFRMQYVSGQGVLSFRASAIYTFTLRATLATGSAGGSADLKVDVRVKANAPPYFTNADMTFTGTIGNANNVEANVFLVELFGAQDDDGDAITYAMSTVPVFEGFEMDQFSGRIRTTKAVRAMCVGSFSALITIRDPYNDPVGPFNLNLELQDANAPPLINNLDRDLHVREDAAYDTNILTLFYFDDNVYPSLSYTLTVVPTEAQDTFRIENNQIRLRAPLDFEKGVTLFSLTIVASDGFCKSVAHTLNVIVVDVNEPPVVFPLDQTLTTCEGRVKLAPSWNITDPDSGDSYTFTGLAPNNIFRIDRNSGAVSTVRDYDLDAAGMAATQALTVTVSDKQDYTATASLTVRFLDCNDNAPTFAMSTQLIPIQECWPVGRSVGQVLAVDIDSAYQGNNVLTYSGANGQAIVQLTGVIQLNATFVLGQVSSFNVIATDQGTTPGPLTSVTPVTVTLYGVKCDFTTTMMPPTTTTTATTIAPTTTPTTTTARLTTSRNILDFRGVNEGWFVSAIVVGVAVGILGLYMLCKYGLPKARDSCRRHAAKDTSDPKDPRNARDASRRTPGQKSERPDSKRTTSPDFNRQPAKRPTPPPYTPMTEVNYPDYNFGYFK